MRPTVLVDVLIEHFSQLSLDLIEVIRQHLINLFEVFFHGINLHLEKFLLLVKLFLVLLVPLLHKAMHLGHSLFEPFRASPVLHLHLHELLLIILG